MQREAPRTLLVLSYQALEILRSSLVHLPHSAIVSSLDNIRESHHVGGFMVVEVGSILPQWLSITALMKVFMDNYHETVFSLSSLQCTASQIQCINPFWSQINAPHQAPHIRYKYVKDSVNLNFSLHTRLTQFSALISCGLT